MGAQLGPSIVFSLFVLIGNPLIVMAIMGVMGYRRRTGFLAGLTVAQISEFSLIVAALGMGLGHITPEIMGLITLVGVVTIFASTYMILYSGSPVPPPFPLPEALRTAYPLPRDLLRYSGLSAAEDIILVGLGNYGSGLAEHLLRAEEEHPRRRFRPPGSRGVAGPRGSRASTATWRTPRSMSSCPLAQARWVVSTVRGPGAEPADPPPSSAAEGSEDKVALTARNEEEAAHCIGRPVPIWSFGPSTTRPSRPLTT